MEDLVKRAEELKNQLEQSAAQHNANVGSISILDTLKAKIEEDASADVLNLLSDMKTTLQEKVSQSLANHNILVGMFTEVQRLLTPVPAEEQSA